MQSLILPLALLLHMLLPNQIIDSVSKKLNINPDAMCKIADMESSWNIKAKNKNSSARGLFQIVNRTEQYIRAKYGIIGDIFDAKVNSEIAGYLMKENIKYYNNKGIEPEGVDLYYAHFFGSYKAYLFKNLKEDMLMKDAFPKEYRYNKSLFKDRTIKQLKEIFEQRYNNARGCNVR
jgi:hypothetical protein